MIELLTVANGFKLIAFVFSVIFILIIIGSRQYMGNKKELEKKE